MTRENKLPIPRQGSRTCETKNKGGKEGGDFEEENNKMVTIEMEMRGAVRLDELGAGLAMKDNEEANSEVGTITKIIKNNNKNTKEDEVIRKAWTSAISPIHGTEIFIASSPVRLRRGPCAGFERTFWHG